MTQKLIGKVLKKRGIKRIEDLTVDERNEYDKWQAILKGEKVTTEKIKEFCETQVKIIEAKFAAGDTSDKQDSYYKACLTVYLTLLRVINSPEDERISLERYLNSLIA